MTDDAFAWRVEAACLAAWPTRSEEVIDGWLIRAAGGAARRLNSVNPTRHGPRDPGPVLASATERLAAVGQPLRVRVPAIATGLDAALDRLGFGTPEGETLTLIAPLATPGAGVGDDPDATLEDFPSLAWLINRVRFAGLDDATSAQLVRSVERTPPDTCFASVHAPPRSAGEGHMGAVGYGAIVDGVMVLEAIVTDPARRRQGHGRTLVRALIGWAARHRARWAALQVQADNAPAVALYRGLGFDRELYRYHYRSLGAPASAGRR